MAVTEFSAFLDFFMNPFHLGELALRKRARPHPLAPGKSTKQASKQATEQASFRSPAMQHAPWSFAASTAHE